MYFSPSARPPEEPWPTLKISCCMQLLSWLRIATPDPDRSKDTRLLLDMKDVKKLCDHLVRVGLLPDVAAGRFYYALGDAVRLPLWDVMNLPPEMMLTPQVPDATAASAPTTPRRTSLLSSAAKGASVATPKLDAALAVLGSGRKFAAKTSPELRNVSPATLAKSGGPLESRNGM